MVLFVVAVLLFLLPAQFTAKYECIKVKRYYSLEHKRELGTFIHACAWDPERRRYQTKAVFPVAGKLTYQWVWQEHAFLVKADGFRALAEVVLASAVTEEGEMINIGFN